MQKKRACFWYYFLGISIGNVRGLLAYTMESKIKSISAISVKRPVNKWVASFTLASHCPSQAVSAVHWSRDNDINLSVNICMYKYFGPYTSLNVFKTNFWNNTVHYCCVYVNVESNTYFSTKFMFCLHEISWSLHLCSTCSTDLLSEPPKSSFCKLRLSDFSRLSSNKSRLSSSTASWK